MTLIEALRPVLNKQLPLALLAYLFATNASAQDHLLPKVREEGFIAWDYDRIIHLVLKNAFAPDVAVRVVVTNPLGAERAVGIRHHRGHDEIFAVRSPERLFSYAEIDDARHEGNSEKDVASRVNTLEPDHAKADDVVAEQCRLPLEPALAARIEAVWNTMLAAKRRDPVPSVKPGTALVETVTLDGTLYAFSNRAGATGVAYGPDATGGAAALLDIVDQLDKACATARGDALAQLSAETEALAKHLELEPSR